MHLHETRARIAANIRKRPKLSITLAAATLLTLCATLYLYRAAREATRHREFSPISTPALRPTRTITFSEGCMTTRCHASLKEVNYVHSPVAAGACQTCHEPDSGGHLYPVKSASATTCNHCHEGTHGGQFEHRALDERECIACHDPHGSSTRMLLVKNAKEASCVDCHPRGGGLAPHAPFAGDRCDLCHNTHRSQNRSLLAATNTLESCRECHPQTVRLTQTAAHSHLNIEGGCLACHASHASAEPGQLKEPLRETCIRCHSDVGTAVAGATVGHAPVLKDTQCIRCHDPHGSGETAMLRSAEQTLCLSCHSSPVTAIDGRTVAAMAAPADSGHSAHQQCSGCHSVHGGTHAKLLAATSSATPQGPYDRSNYALCFSCHDPALAEAPTGTQFRDGERNLHEVHLKKGDQSRGCSTCHAVHTVNAPRQITQTVRFEGSSWAMPMDFTLTSDGGRCGSGCHEPLRYSRQPGGAGNTRTGATR